MSDKPVAAGKSSFELLDMGKVFAIIDVKPNSNFLDLACGIGKYSVQIANNIDEKGNVYAVDLWQGGIEALNQEIAIKGIKNIKPILADISRKLPLEENSIDSCFWQRYCTTCQKLIKNLLFRRSPVSSNQAAC